MIPYLIITQLELTQKPLYYWENNNKDGEYAKIRKELKEATSYQFDSSHLILTDIYGNPYSIIIFLNKDKTVFEINIWNFNGSISILTVKINVTGDYKEFKLSFEDYNKIMNKITKFYTDDIVPCNECGKDINWKTAAGRYFAGLFCEKCWESKWKAIEAKETYN
jgi:hypothetical protein